MGCAKTGSGKTAAFVLPVLQKLSEEPYGIFCLVLTPTRSVLDLSPSMDLLSFKNRSAVVSSKTSKNTFTRHYFWSIKFKLRRIYLY